MQHRYNRYPFVALSSCSTTTKQLLACSEVDMLFFVAKHDHVCFYFVVSVHCIFQWTSENRHKISNFSVIFLLRYQREKSGVSYQVALGPFTASISEIATCIQASLVTFPVNFGVVFIFKKTASWSQWKQRDRVNKQQGPSNASGSSSKTGYQFFLLFICEFNSSLWDEI